MSKGRHPRLHRWNKSHRYNVVCGHWPCKAVRCAYVSPDLKQHLGLLGVRVIQKGRQCRQARLKNGVYCADHRKYLIKTSPAPRPQDAKATIRYIHPGNED